MEASKREAIRELANTEGWRIFKAMLEYDERFALGILNRPKPAKPTESVPHPDPEWVTDPHDLGRARGVLNMAQKYLNLVRSAIERVNQE